MMSISNMCDYLICKMAHMYDYRRSPISNMRRIICPIARKSDNHISCNLYDLYGNYITYAGDIPAKDNMQ